MLSLGIKIFGQNRANISISVKKELKFEFITWYKAVQNSFSGCLFGFFVRVTHADFSNWIQAKNSHNNLYFPPGICKFTASSYKSYIQPFNLFFLVFAIWGSSGAEPVLVPKTENTEITHVACIRKVTHNSLFQTLW